MTSSPQPPHQATTIIFISFTQLGLILTLFIQELIKSGFTKNNGTRLLNLSPNYIFQHLLAELGVHRTVSIFTLNESPTATEQTDVHARTGPEAFQHSHAQFQQSIYDPKS